MKAFVVNFSASISI